jgi:hypothetical protein
MTACDDSNDKDEYPMPERSDDDEDDDGEEEVVLTAAGVGIMISS